MPSLLIRNMSESTKRQLAIRAAGHGRSQQDEVLSILDKALNSENGTWLDSLLEKSESVGGIEIPEVKRHSPRLTGALL